MRIFQHVTNSMHSGGCHRKIRWCLRWVKRWIDVVGHILLLRAAAYWFSSRADTENDSNDARATQGLHVRVAERGFPSLKSRSDVDSRADGRQLCEL